MPETMMNWIREIVSLGIRCPSPSGDLTMELYLASNYSATVCFYMKTGCS